MVELSIIQQIVVIALPLIFAITLHEVAHGYVAYFCGDKTAKARGRLTLDPLKHIDLVGTIIVPLVMFVSTSFIFGWAKPVPVDPRNFRSPRRDMALVALAGPFSNLLMAILWALVKKMGYILAQREASNFSVILLYMGDAGITINVVLGVLNFIPIPPLDGSRILSSILPPRMAYSYNRLEPYGLVILILLMLTGVLSSVMLPIIRLIMSAINYTFL